MTLPSSGPLSLLDIQNEFGGVNPISLSEYYSGGAYVPGWSNGTSPVAIPVSGPISISDFYGTGFLDMQKITVGISGVDVGYTSSGLGSIDTGISKVYPGSSISSLFCNTDAHFVLLTISGLHSNSGWNKLIINFYEYPLANASYFQYSSSTYWYWPSTYSTVNPFGTTPGVSLWATWS